MLFWILLIHILNYFTVLLQHILSKPRIISLSCRVFYQLIPCSSVYSFPSASQWGLGREGREGPVNLDQTRANLSNHVWPILCSDLYLRKYLDLNPDEKQLEGNTNSEHVYSCLKRPTDRGSWWAQSLGWDTSEWIGTDHTVLATMQIQHLTPVVSKACCCCLVSCVQHFVTPWIVACQAPLSIEFPRQRYWSG